MQNQRLFEQATVFAKRVEDFFDDHHPFGSCSSVDEAQARSTLIQHAANLRQSLHSERARGRTVEHTNVFIAAALALAALLTGIIFF